MLCQVKSGSPALEETKNCSDVKLRNNIFNIAGLPDGIFNISIPKIPILVYLGGLLNEKCWYILCPLGIFYSRSV
jgi:hypothetical protein